ncbi:hypothetical protein C5C57_05595 [Rathayibacter sp. AY1C5]|nr:hypothetical protein C5C57_05595 [Rathayibacter sp. AY1C5]
MGKATQIKKGQVLNPKGRPKGSKSLSTLIQQMMMDENFETLLPDPQTGWKEFRGAPARAIVTAAMLRAVQGDLKAADWLAKYGYGTKVEIDATITEGPIPLLAGVAPEGPLVIEDDDDGGTAQADDSADEDQQS